MGIAEKSRWISGEMIPAFKGDLGQRLKELSEKFSLEPMVYASYLFSPRA